MFLDLIEEQIAEIQAIWKKIEDFHLKIFIFSFLI